MADSEKEMKEAPGNQATRIDTLIMAKVQVIFGQEEDVLLRGR